MATVMAVMLAIQLAAASGFNDKLVAEYVGQLRAEAIAASRDLLLGVVVVVAGQQVTEHQLWHIHLVGLVDLNRQPFAIVPHLDPLLLRVDLDLDAVHALVALQIVRSIHKDLVEDLVQGWHVADAAVLHLLLLSIPDPKLIVLLLH